MKSIVYKSLYRIGSCMGANFPKVWITFRYFVRFHRFIRWNNPQNLNEKILYLSLKTDTKLWSELSDKYLVREYVKSCGYENILVKLYGHWNTADGIDFDGLPKSFVLKTNHGSGEIVIIQDKNLVDQMDIRSYLNREISKPYGEIEAGKHYSRIVPCIIAEELLMNDVESAKYSKSIVDYKIWCFKGKAHYIWTCCNRDKAGAEVLLYDRDWIPHPEYSIFTMHYRQGEVIPKPSNFSEMINIAEVLAHPFPCVRVDLYNIGGKIYFGELTFTSLGGMMNYFTNDFLNMAGDLIDLNYKA